MFAIYPYIVEQLIYADIELHVEHERDTEKTLCISSSRAHTSKLQLFYLERWRIFLRLRWRRRVLFFFHFQRILEWAFFHGLDLCPPPRRRSTRWRVDSVEGGGGGGSEQRPKGMGGGWVRAKAGGGGGVVRAKVRGRDSSVSLESALL